MLKTNIPGAIIIALIVLGIIGYAFTLRLSLEWDFYFKILATVALIALVVSLITHFVPQRKQN